MKNFTDEEITIRSVAIVYNQHKLNLEILKQVYQIICPGRDEDSGGTHANNDDHEQRLIRVFKQRFRELCGELGGSKIQAIVQIGSAEALEKELKQVARKDDLLAEKLDDTAEIDVIMVVEQCP